ncbi:dormancy-associated protein homolog 3-like isoform X3 [Rutidosis leptorrhynchoides]|uniref:dormancy-associated protein homolog 3-like isoform X3 n=1 Tax=Rutidosis leptorrhynchoides TaxID=125765 RepID=UPI003A99C410
MSLLDQLWDDTLAGPCPDKGLGKLRKLSTFSSRPSDSGKEISSPATNKSVDDSAMKVTRSIMIVRPERTQSDTPPSSPAGSTPPEADQRHLGFVGSLHRTLSKRQPGSETGALVLLTTCEM